MTRFLLISIHIIFALLTQSVYGDPCSDAAATKRGGALQAYNQIVAENGKVPMTVQGTFPTLTATICTTDKSNNGNAKWTLKIDPLVVPVKKIKRTFCPGETFRATGQTFTVTPTQGGNATLSWALGNKSGQIKFQIVGKNPIEEAVLAAIGNDPWFAPYVAKRESWLKQFEFRTGKKSEIDWPMMSFDGGVGVFQLTNPQPTCDQVWKWPSNVAEGVKRLRDFNARAETYMNQQRAVARNSNKKHVDVPVPRQKVANCVFEDGTERTIKDAVALKKFNGIALGNFCVWDKVNKKWKFNPINDRKENYVESVCKKVPK
jgi:hypothetical protein